MLDFSDTTGIRREREKLGAGRWSGALLLLLVAGIPLMLGVHFKLFPDAAKPKVHAVYDSLDDVPLLFDPETQQAQVRYCGEPEGEVEIVGRDVEFSPTTGDRCWPITPAIVRMLRGAEDRQRELQAAATAERQEEAERAERERRQAAAREAERAFRTRYVNASAVGQLDSGQVMVAMSDARLGRSIAEALRERGVPVGTNLFTGQIFEPGVVSRLAAGDRGFLDRLELGRGQATLLLGELAYEPLAETGYGKMVNLRGHLAVHLVPLAGGVPVSMPTLSEVGAGFNEEQARGVLHERLVDALLEQPAMARIGNPPRP